MPLRPRSHLRQLTPYAWEASASEIAAAAGIPESEIVRFDTNTAPWPPVAWERTVVDVPRLPANEYPHPSNEPLRSLLAASLEVHPDQVIVTSGADEALLLVATVFLGPGRRAAAADPTFSMFRVVTETVGGEIVPVPVDEHWDLPRERVLDAVCQPDVRVAWLCTPNNPTGRLLDADLVEAVASAAPDVTVVIDEAYAEIAGQSLAPVVRRHPNVLLVRTFSKAYGLAGARVGYVMGDADVIRLLDAVRLPQNLSAFGVLAATRAFEDQAGLAERVALLRSERDRLSAELDRRGWEIVPSRANFLLVRPPADTAGLIAWLQAGGLIVRSYAGHPRMADWLRITVRSPEENDRLLARIDTRPR